MKVALTLTALLCLAAVTPLAAQQQANSPPQVRASTPASPTSTTLPGPRLRPDWPRQAPVFADSSASGSAAAVAGTHTFTVTTVVLVLLVVVAVLLIVD